MSEPAIALPHHPPYSVDDLFDMPDDGNRYEVLGGSLIVSPAPTPMHQLAADEVRHILRGLVPPGVKVVTAAAVRIPGGDGPVPDVVVTTADLRSCRSGLPVEQVHTVVEVVSPSNALNDRAYKRELYAEAGIPCYWRIEIEPWRGHDGPLPLVVARLWGPDGWHSVEVAAGKAHTLELAVGRVDGETPFTIDVEFDPAVLVAY